MNNSRNNYLQTALHAANIARTTTSRHFRSRFDVSNKPDLSPVTVADQETEEAIRTYITSRHPTHGIVGEEGGSHNMNQPWQWIVDPIDGTKSFVVGRPIFGTLIALMEGNQPLLGLIDQSILNERWVGIRGRQTTFNEVPCHTRESKHLALCSICCTTPEMFNEVSLARFRNLADRCQFRVWGGDCYNYGLLAAGFTDIICEADLYPYDYLPLVPVVEGAGGMITDWDGNALTLNTGGTVLATANEELHQTALTLLNP